MLPAICPSNGFAGAKPLYKGKRRLHMYVRPHVKEAMKKKKHYKNISNNNLELKEFGMECGSDENFAFIAGFTSNCVPFGITHEEMKELEKEEKLTNKNDYIDLPF